ncbi:MAG: IcmT/TraK family protein [Leptospirillum sp.]|jgi:intracellular multiplication protein IcmT
MWRWASSVPRLGPVDARAGIALLIFLFHWRLWTLGVAVLGVVLFGFLERFGLTLPVAWRVLLRWISGPVVWPENPMKPVYRFYREY